MSCGLFKPGIWACCILATGVLGQNAFSNPPAPGPNLNYLNNEIYAIGEQLNIQYCQDLDTLYNINLWQQGNTVDEVPFTNLTDQGCVAKSWTISTNQDLCQGNVFFLSLDDDRNIGFNSHYFNLTNADGSVCSTSTSPTSAAATSSTVSSTSAASTSATAGTVTQSSQSTAQTSAQPTPEVKSKGLSTGAAIGIGVACGLFGCIALCLGAFFLWRRRQRKQKRNMAEISSSGYNNQAGALGQKYEMPGQSASRLQQHEMDGQSMSRQQKYEMDSSDGQRSSMLSR